MSLATEVSNRVSQALLNDPRTDQAVIDVSAEQEVVTLSGSVDSPSTSQAAEQIARDQRGVISVINELKIT